VIRKFVQALESCPGIKPVNITSNKSALSFFI
jgi:hypothetical protein